MISHAPFPFPMRPEVPNVPMPDAPLPPTNATDKNNASLFNRADELIRDGKYEIRKAKALVEEIFLKLRYEAQWAICRAGTQLQEAEERVVQLACASSNPLFHQAQSALLSKVQEVQAAVASLFPGALNQSHFPLAVEILRMKKQELRQMKEAILATSVHLAAHPAIEEAHQLLRSKKHELRKAEEGANPLLLTRHPALKEPQQNLREKENELHIVYHKLIDIYFGINSDNWREVLFIKMLVNLETQDEKDAHFFQIIKKHLARNEVDFVFSIIDKHAKYHCSTSCIEHTLFLLGKKVQKLQRHDLFSNVLHLIPHRKSEFGLGDPAR